MQTTITADLPFSWCEYCDRIDLETEQMIADGQVYESRQVCGNASACEAMVRAMEREIKMHSDSLTVAELEKRYSEAEQAGILETDEKLKPKDTICWKRANEK